MTEHDRNGNADVSLSLEWKPFLIDPGTNPRGETVQAYCRRRWGGAGWTQHLKEEGRRDGASFGNWKWWPHTLKAHQLIQYCGEDEHITLSTSPDILSVSDHVNQLLFHAEYEEGANLSDLETLVRIGQQAGVTNLDDLRAYLSEDRGADQVRREIALGRQRYRISGVPFVVMGKNDRRPYGISGAKPWENWYDMLQELSEE